ncbi:hypothetical protein XELAEV_18029130mg [Xenopus laevis]|uniref:Uncharacterized protein n=1 Tax=Xenopus laevis TaxID=8355 RepID=A0A974HH99_XENLA|nr:hypothetical protein XELAEV_18029130mg [Xenopus laevis]
MAANSINNLIGHNVFLHKRPNHEIKPFAFLFNFPSTMVKSSTCKPPGIILDGATTSLTLNAAKEEIINRALNNIHS